VAYQTNPGRLPPQCEIRDQFGEVTGWRSVHVRLFGGHDTAKLGLAPWPAFGGRPPTQWRVSKVPHAFEIEEWELA
jgi:hypothetical protein